MTLTFVLMAGLPGTGKSTLAATLAEATDGVVLSKDSIRAALFPGRLTDYTETQDALCFGALLEAAAYIAQHEPRPNYTFPRPPFLFIDGRTFRKRSQVETAIRAAEGARCHWRILHLTCPDDVAIRRIELDEQSGKHPARNRDERLYLESKARFEPIDYPCLRVDTSESLDECIQLCLSYIRSTAHESESA
jgi:hypothetical protein